MMLALEPGTWFHLSDAQKISTTWWVAQLAGMGLTISGSHIQNTASGANRLRSYGSCFSAVQMIISTWESHPAPLPAWKRGREDMEQPYSNILKKLARQRVSAGKIAPAAVLSRTELQSLYQKLKDTYRWSGTVCVDGEDTVKENKLCGNRFQQQQAMLVKLLISGQNTNILAT